MKKIFLILLLFPLLTRAQISIHIYASATTICNGTTVYFTDTLSGTSSPHFRWRLNGINTGIDSSVFTTDTLANDDTVQCLLTSITGDTILATSNSIIITVQDTPATGIITGSNNVCVGSTITLFDSVSGGAWSAGNTNAMVDSGLVTGVSEGYTEYGVTYSVDTIFYIVTNVCGSSVASKIIVINPFPDAGFVLGNPYTYAPLCTGGSIFVNGGDGVASFAYTTYMYATNDNASLSSGDEYVYGNHAGEDTIINIATNGCDSDTARELVTVTATPTAIPIVASAVKVGVGNTIILMDTTTAFFPEWSASNGNAVLSNSGSYPYFNQILTGVTMGLVTITLGLANSCGYAESSIVITVDSTTNVSAFAQSNDDITIYPNPSNDKLVIHTFVTTYHSCSIINSAGQLVLQQALNGPFTTINITSLQADTYFITIDGDNKKYKGKFIKRQ